jgi:hypothetical protein
MKKHFLETVDIEKRFVGLYGEHEATLGARGVYDSGAIFGCTRLLERRERRAIKDVMKQD